MMIQKILLILIVSPVIIMAQETKKVTRENKNPPYKEVYHVLKSDTATLHGSYQKLNHKGKVLVSGFYKNGLKDSIWTEYLWDGENVKSKGHYSQDKKAGLWEFYDFKKELEQKYDFTKKELVYFKADSREKDEAFRMIKDGDTIKVKLDRPPLYIGGSAMMLEAINKNIRYPREARENRTSGKVYVAFTIDHSGKATSHRVIKGIGDGCDEEALRTVKEIPGNWLAGLLDGEAVDVEYVLPVSFTIR